MVKRPCLDCGTLIVSSGRCPACRGTNDRRGYGRQHQGARRSLRANLPGYCGYGCGTWLMPEGDWAAAHVVDGDPSAGWVASCRSCNERAKVRRYA